DAAPRRPDVRKSEHTDLLTPGSCHSDTVAPHPDSAIARLTGMQSPVQNQRVCTQFDCNASATPRQHRGAVKHALVELPHWGPAGRQSITSDCLCQTGREAAATAK